MDRAVPVCLSGHPHTQQTPRSVGVHIKDRRSSPYERLGAKWGRRKYQHFGFDSAETFVENEVLIMKVAREVYTFIPSIINYDKVAQKIYVEKVEGRTIDTYIKETNDFSVIEKLRTALSHLHSREVAIQSDIANEFGVKPRTSGYINLYNFESTNFKIDNSGNVWILSFEISSLKEQKYVKEDDKELELLIQDMLNKYTQNTPVAAADIRN